MALAALIDDVEARNEWRDTDVVRHATSLGLKLTTSDMTDYRLRGMKHLVPAKIVALGRGLQIPPYRVAIAILSDKGIDFPLDVRTPEDAIDADIQLSAATRRNLLAILREDRAN